MYDRIFALLSSRKKSIFLFGPRGTGKTTWLQTSFPDSLYFDLLDSFLYTDLLAQPGRLESLIPPDYDNWVIIDETVTDLQPSPVRSDQPVEEIRMVPMGCARLRMCCLPTIGDGLDAREWKKVRSHEEAMRLRLGGEGG